MNREYLEDYEQKESSEYGRLMKEIREGKFYLEKDRFPRDDRFVKLQKPVAVCAGVRTSNTNNLWAQVPFCGSLILLLPPLPRRHFEREFFKVSEIPQLIDFVKDTGKLQIAFNMDLRLYEGLDFLDPFFKELRPPSYLPAPYFTFGTKKEFKEVYNIFHTLGNAGFLDRLRKLCEEINPKALSGVLDRIETAYAFLKLGHYAVVEEIENLMIDDPVKALTVLTICRKFIVSPVLDLRSDLTNFALRDIKETEILPLAYRLQKVRFPCEIGKFLLRKLTYAPQGPRACYDLIAHYDDYDLQKVQESLNEAIVANHPDVVKKSAQELSEILDNVWNDPTISRRLKGLKIGVPLSIAAIGGVVAGPIGATEGFLAGLGFDVVSKSIDIGAEGLSEKLARLRTKSYQANVYDFKKKYKGKITERTTTVKKGT